MEMRIGLKGLTDVMLDPCEALGWNNTMPGRAEGDLSAG